MCSVAQPDGEMLSMGRGFHIPFPESLLKHRHPPPQVWTFLP